MTTIIYLTSASVSPWVAPSDFGGTNTFEFVGEGANGVAGTSSKGGSGGGGGAYVAYSNYSSVLPGQSATFTIGAGNTGTDTTFNSSAFIAKAANGTAGGSSSSSVGPSGATKNGGGAGGTEGTHPGAAGGGGAGGPNGAGANAGAAASGGGAGGGGGDGGTVGANGGTGHGANGGTGTGGSTGGVGSITSASPGGNGSLASGGGGGNNDSPGATCSGGGNGGAGGQWADVSNGPGGGGGGGGGTATAAHNAGFGGNGGGYGAGGGGSGQFGSGGTSANPGTGAPGVIRITYVPNSPFPPPPPPPPPGIVTLNFQTTPLAALVTAGLTSNGTGCWDELGNAVAAGVPNLSPQNFGLWCGPSRTQYLTDPGNPTSANWPGGVQSISLNAGTYTCSCHANDNSGVTITGTGIATTTIQRDSPYKFTLASTTTVTFTQTRVLSNGSTGTPDLVWINCQGIDAECSPILTATAGSTGADGQVSISSTYVNFNSLTSSSVWDWYTDSVSAYYAGAITDGTSYQPRLSIGSGVINPIYGTSSTSVVNPSVVTGLCNAVGLSAQNGNFYASLLGGLHVKDLTTATNPPGSPSSWCIGNGGSNFVGLDLPGRVRRANYYNLVETNAFLNNLTGAINLYCVGDSQTLGAGGITFGAGGTHENWGWHTYRKFALAGFPITINGVTGRGLVAPASPTPISDPTTISTVNAALVSGASNILNCFFGINDLQHSITGNALYEDACSYYSTMYAAGAGWTTIILWTIPPGQGTPETQRAGAGVGTSFNDTLRWAFQHPGQIPAGQTQSLPVGPTYYLCDIGSDPIIGQAGQNTNAIYYSTADNLHWNTYGLRYVAKTLFAPLVNSLLGLSLSSTGPSPRLWSLTPGGSAGASGSPFIHSIAA